MITLYMAYIFFSIALLFVARVVSLWISMIFSPLAFISYTLPFDIGKMSHQKWWPELFKNAFLAPVFIFFLYLIVLFLDILKDLTYNDSDPLFGKLMGVVIPFAILFVLLMKAKELAVEYSGEMGKGITKAGAVLGGVALGAATGGVAMAARGTVGRVAANLSESNRMKDWAARSRIGARTLKMTSGIASGSFDARGIKIVGKGLADTGLKNLGKAQVGGFTKVRADAVKKKKILLINYLIQVIKVKQS